MVQREVGERFAAAPGHARLRRAVGARPARLRRARAAPGLAHRLPPGAERRLGARRARAPRPGARRRRCARSCSSGFAHRRKALAALARAGAGARRRSASASARRSRRSASPPTRAPRRSRPSELARAVRGALRVRLRALAPGKVNLCLFVGAPRADGLHPLVSVVQPVSLADELTLEPAGGRATRSSAPASRAPNLAGARARRVPRARPAGTPAAAADDRQAHAGRRRDGRRLGRRRRRAAARRARRRPATTRCSRELAPRLGADVPACCAPAACSMTGAGEHVEPLPDPGAARRARAAARRTRSRRPPSTARPTALGAAPRARRAARAARGRAGARRRSRRAARQRPRGRRPLAVPGDRRRARRRRAPPAPSTRWSPAPGRPCSACSPAPSGPARGRAQRPRARPRAGAAGSRSRCVG